jgi:hypothetical protein
MLGSLASGIEPLRAVSFAQAYQPQARAIALLGMRTSLENPFHDAPRGGPVFLGPVDQTRRSPFHMRAMRAGHVLGKGRVFVVVASHVRRHPAVFVVDLDD